MEKTTIVNEKDEIAEINWFTKRDFSELIKKDSFKLVYSLKFFIQEFKKQNGARI